VREARCRKSGKIERGYVARKVGGICCEQKVKQIAERWRKNVRGI